MLINSIEGLIDGERERVKINNIIVTVYMSKNVRLP